MHIRDLCWNKATKIRSPGAGIRILKQKQMDSLQGAETKTLPEHKVIQGLAQTGATLYQAKYRTGRSGCSQFWFLVHCTRPLTKKPGLFFWSNDGKINEHKDSEHDKKKQKTRQMQSSKVFHEGLM